MPEPQDSPREDDKKVHVSFSAPDELMARVEAYAADRGMAKMAAIRELCRAGVAAMLSRGYQAASGNDGDDATDAAVSDSQPAGRAKPLRDADYVALVSEHPRATVAEIARALDVSRTTARTRMNALIDAGALTNAGTDRTPLWEVPGVEHAPEELLTARQAEVLRMLRESPELGTSGIAAALHTTATTVNNDCNAMGVLGLTRRNARGRWEATPLEGAEPASADPAADDPVLAYVLGHPGCTVTQVADAIGQDRSSASHKLSLLVSSGSVERCGGNTAAWFCAPGTPETQALDPKDRELLDVLRDGGPARVVDLAAAVGHSEPYVRRHLKELERLGLAERQGAYGWQVVEGEDVHAADNHNDE